MLWWQEERKCNQERNKIKNHHKIVFYRIDFSRELLYFESALRKENFTACLTGGTSIILNYDWQPAQSEDLSSSQLFWAALCERFVL